MSLDALIQAEGDLNKLRHKAGLPEAERTFYFASEYRNALAEAAAAKVAKKEPESTKYPRTTRWDGRANGPEHALDHALFAFLAVAAACDRAGVSFEDVRIISGAMSDHLRLCGVETSAHTCARAQRSANSLLDSFAAIREGKLPKQPAKAAEPVVTATPEMFDAVRAKVEGRVVDFPKDPVAAAILRAGAKARNEPDPGEKPL